MAWLFVLASGDLNSGSELPSEAIGLCVTSSGKPIVRPLSWPGWKTRPWIQLLYGTTSKPSMANRGAESWISSLRATRASHSPLPASVVGHPILGIYGQTFTELFARFDPQLSSWKTSQGIFDWVLMLSSPILPKQGSMRNGEPSRRVSADPAKEGKGYSAWATPDTAPEAPCSGSNVKIRPGSLGIQARTWRNPEATDGEGGVMEIRECANAHYKLRDQALNWPTPRARENEQRATRIYGGKKRNRVLAEESVNWPTPRQTDVFGAGKHGEGGMDLRTTIESWPTPSARDPKGRDVPNHQGGASLPHYVMTGERYHAGPPAQATAKLGKRSLKRLNPLFVEWLMAWPLGWTDCGRAVTALFQYVRHWRLLLFGRE